MQRNLRVLAAAVAIAAGLGVAGCGGDGSSETSATTDTTETTASTGDATAGKEVFTSACGGCHTLADAGTTGAIGPNLDDLAPDEATVAEQVRNGGGAMPAFSDQLTGQQIADVAAYVSSATG